MTRFIRLFSAWLVLILSILTATSARAQSEQLVPLPEVQPGLWKTVMFAAPPRYSGSPEQACLLQQRSFSPDATLLPHVYMSENTRGCDWEQYVGGVRTRGPIHPTIVVLECPSNEYSVRRGVCVLNRVPDPPICIPCEIGPQSGTPQIDVAHPMNVNSGLKVLSETDYSSADGLFTVERDYTSRKGFGWSLLMPGYLEMGGDFAHEVYYTSRNGGKDKFVASSPNDWNNWTFTLPTQQGSPDSVSRLRLSLVVTPSTDRGNFVRDNNLSAIGPGEMRLDMPDGEYVVFRRANNDGFDPNAWRRLVPVEHGKPGGYKIFYDYNGANYTPYRVRDSLNRQMLLTWIDAPSPIIEPGFNGAKVISKIELPDNTRLEYTYDDTKSSFSIPIPNWAIQNGLDVRDVTPNFVSIIIEGRKNRLRSVTRKTATGTVLSGRQYDYTYNWNPAALTKVRDQNGTALAEYSYVAGELVTSSKLAGDVQPYLFEHFEVYNDNNLSQFMVRRVHGPLGRVDDYWLLRKSTWAEVWPIGWVNGLPTTTTPADNRSLEYSVSGPLGVSHMMTKSVDSLGRATQYTVDPNNRRPVYITEAAQTTAQRGTALEWHPIWDLPTRVEREGVRVDMAYTADALVASSTVTDLTTHTVPYATSGQSRTTTYSWGPNARLLSVNGPRPVDAQGLDDIINFAYDTVGNVTSMTNALGHVTSFSGYDANGRPTSMTDANGIITQFTYDLLGRTTSVRVKHPTTASLDAVTSFTYDIEGRVKTVTAPASTALTMNYDLAGQLKSVVASNNERIDFVHDPMGNVTTQTVKRTNGSTASSITRTFDALGRMLTEALGPGRTWTYAYDKVGNLTNLKSPRNHSTANSFDALDRLVASVKPDGGDPTMAYDALDGLTNHTDAVGATSSFVRNGFGEVIREINRDRGTSTYYYNSAGDKTAAIDGRGQRINYSYDILGRLLSATPQGLPAAQATTYIWDTAVITGGYPKGRLSRVIDSGTTVEYRYDHRGNVTIKRQRIGTDAWAQLSFTYDLADRRTQITYPSGRLVNYTFNTLGRVTQVRTKAAASVTTWTNLASGLTYEAFGAITRADYGNGLRMIQSWGNDGRLANRRLERSADSVRLSSLTYAYDNNDNITGITDTLVAAKSFAYGYDEVDRITTKVGGEGTFKREDYVYDDNGNVLKVDWRTTSTATTPAQSHSYLIAANTNRLTRIFVDANNARTFTYDARGNLTGDRLPDGSNTIVAYDGQARLISYTSGGSTQTMLYNGMDERIRVVTTPAVGLADTRVYIYDLDHRIVGEYGPGGNADVKAEYIWTLPEVGASGPTGGDDGLGGYMPLAVSVGTSGTLAWVHSHHNGAPILMTNATGATVTHGDHAVLGFPGQFANAKLLAGAQYYYNRYRDYDAVTGRYIQADPIGLAGDENPYLYAGGNVLRFMDPLGLETYWERYTGLPDSYRVNAINVLAGWSDGFTFGGTYFLRGLVGANRDVDVCNVSYLLGDITSLLSLRGGLKLVARGPLIVREGIYEFVSKSGKVYVGQSGNIPVRIAQHLASGKLPLSELSNVVKTKVTGGRTAREIAEQLRIDALGGLRNLENVRNSIGPKRRHLMP